MERIRQEEVKNEENGREMNYQTNRTLLLYTIVIVTIVGLLFVFADRASAQVLGPPLPDAISCHSDTTVYSTLSAVTDTGTVYYSGMVNLSFNADGSSADPSEPVGYDCAGMSLQDIENSTTSPKAINFGYATTTIVGNGLSTDPVLDVLVAAILMLYAALYVRRVFFS